MNLRSTAWLFAVMFSMLWLFGLMLAFKKNPLDKSYVVPTLQAARDVDIVSVTIQRKPQGKDPQEFLFTQDNDVWRLKDANSNLAVKVESFRINDIVNQIKNARKDEEADVTNDLARYGLDTPQATITLKGRTRAKPPELKDDDKDKKDEKDEKKEPPAKEKEWKFHLGKESPDKKYVFANSSDEPTRVFGVTKSSVDSLFFDDPNHLRTKGLFDFSDATAKLIEVKQGATELELKKGDDNLWRFVKPNLGYADVEGPAPPKELPPEIKLPKSGVKGLLDTIKAIRVDADADFVAMHKDNLTKYQLEDGKELLRIQVGTPDGKKDNKETLLVGTQVRDYYYARLANDEGVFKLPAKVIDPVLSALKDPGKLRSLDVGHFDPKSIDAITLKHGDEETKLWKPEGKPWQVQIGKDKPKKADEKAVQKLIDTLQGKRQIQRFHDAAGEAAKKLDAELGLDAPKVIVTLYANGLEKKDDLKDKKDDKKDEKKEEKKESKTEDGFNLKKDATPALSLHFGKADKETVAVLRPKDDRFVVAKSMLDAVAPAEGALAYLDPALPSFDTFDVARLELQRGAKKLELEKATGAQAGRWLVKEGADKADQNLADTLKTDFFFRSLGSLTAKKWVKRLDAKDDLEKYGLKAPALTATVNVKKNQITPAGAASALGILSVPAEARLFAAVNALAANLQADKGETIVVQFGKDAGDKEVYAKHSGSDLLFTAPAELLKMLRDTDLRDKSVLLVFEHTLAAGAFAAAAAQPLAGVATLAPIVTGQVADLDPAKIKEIRLAIRTSFELREFAFERKDKSWTDASGLKDFHLDADKVEQVVKDFARLRADRFISLTGGPKTDHKLAAKDYLVKMDIVTDDGKTVTITIGAPLERFGHFAHASNWSDAVFLVSSSKVEPLLRGIEFFAKERVVAAE